MSRPYTDQLAEWVKKRGKSRPRQDKGLVAFIAVKDDIEEAMAAGYALKTIWEHLHETGKIPFRYETFLKHTKKHIKAKPKRPLVANTSEPAEKSKPAEKPKVAKAGSEPRKLATQLKEFEVNPIAKKEDLI